MRTIRIKSPDRQSLVVFRTSAVTRGELIKEINESELGISTANIDFVDYNSDVTYSLDGAVLPSIDCLLLIVPTKTSQGSFDYTIEELYELGYNDLRSYGSKLNKTLGANIDLSGNRSNILNNILDYYEEMESLKDDDYEDDDDYETDDFIYVPVKKSDVLEILNLKNNCDDIAVSITYSDIEDKYRSAVSQIKQAAIDFIKSQK